MVTILQDRSRLDRTKQYKLIDIVTVAICGIACRADTWVGIERIGNWQTCSVMIHLLEGDSVNHSYNRTYAVA